MAFYRYARRNRGPRTDIDRDETLAARIITLQQNPSITSKDKEIVDSFANYRNKNAYLTHSQVKWFNQLEKKYSTENQEKQQAWIADWNKTKQKRFDTAVKYYARTSYWQNLVASVQNNKDFIPSQNAFEKIVNNDYSKKVYTEYTREAKFADGDEVTISSNNKNSLSGAPLGAQKKWFSLPKDVVLFVVSSNVMVPFSYAKGAKVYKVFVAALLTDPETWDYRQKSHCSGSLPKVGDVFYCEERNLKRFK